jgi:salicylate 5-hydroxylase small subunit
MSAQSLADYVQLLQFHADYAAALDAGNHDAWLECFTDDCHYRIQPRENHSRGLPLATLALDGKAMLRDRVYGIKETLFHEPYYQRHVIGPPRVLQCSDSVIHAESNYLVIRTKHAEPSEVFNAGRYLDEFARQTNGELKLRQRVCVFDSELIPNSMIYPL